MAVSGSPFRKWFLAGRVEARRSRVGRAHHALVWCAGHARQLHIHPRDQFDNPAPLAEGAEGAAPGGFSAQLSPLGAEPDAALARGAAFHYDAVNQRVSMALCFERAGIYRAAIFYDKVLLHNGQFDCIVLTASDAATVQRSISGKASVGYEARLLGPGKPRRVLCCVGAKHLTLKDYLLKFIPKRITSFRLCPSTKVPTSPVVSSIFVCTAPRSRAHGSLSRQLILKPTPEGSGPGGEFTLDDGVQPSIDLVSPERDLIAATFTQLLIANCGGEDTFKVHDEVSKFRHNVQIGSE